VKRGPRLGADAIEIMEERQRRRDCGRRTGRFPFSIPLLGYQYWREVGRAYGVSFWSWR